MVARIKIAHRPEAAGGPAAGTSWAHAMSWPRLELSTHALRAAGSDHTGGNSLMME